MRRYILGLGTGDWRNTSSGQLNSCTKSKVWLAGSVEEEIKLTMTGIEQRSLRRPDRSVVAIPTVKVILEGTVMSS